MQVYAKQAKDRELLGHATEIRIRAEIRAGEMLAEMKKRGERATGKKNLKHVSDTQPVSPTLAELGVEQHQSYRWQNLAARVSIQ
jgi:hypothetical protein